MDSQTTMPPGGETKHLHMDVSSAFCEYAGEKPYFNGVDIFFSH